MVVREVYEYATTSRLVRRTASYDACSFVDVYVVATVIPIDKPRQRRIFAIATRSVCNPNILLCTPSHQSRSSQAFPRI